MRIAVLGSQGQLGRDLCPRLAGEVIPLTRNEINLDHPQSILAYLQSNPVEVLINCAAYNFVDRAETEPEAAFQVNAWATRSLAQACEQVGCKLVQISTDYVFGLDTTHSTPYAETDAPGPVSIYGLSKLSGEYLVRAGVSRHLVIRTCGLFGVWGSGGKGGNFVETMLRVAGQGKPLRVVDDQRCTPTYTAELATGIAGLIQAKATGLYHLTNSGDCSWFEFAQEIFRQSGMLPDLTPTPSRDYPTLARRPGYSVLSSQKAAAILGAVMRPWQEALAAYLEERKTKPA
jgi:dTDP-4-dehydrorhamnose reductase